MEKKGTKKNPERERETQTQRDYGFWEENIEKKWKKKDCLPLQQQEIASVGADLTREAKHTACLELTVAQWVPP